MRYWTPVPIVMMFGLLAALFISSVTDLRLEPFEKYADLLGIAAVLVVCFGWLLKLAFEHKRSWPSISPMLDRWGDEVKNFIIDVGADIPAQELIAEEEDQILKPLDRQRFKAMMTKRFEDSLDFIAENMADGRTDYDLLCNHKKIEPYLTNMSWEAIATALELRQPEPERVTADSARARAESLPARCMPNKPSPRRPTESWAKKYRRMVAQGM